MKGFERGNFSKSSPFIIISFLSNSLILGIRGVVRFKIVVEAVFVAEVVLIVEIVLVVDDVVICVFGIVDNVIRGV